MPTWLSANMWELFERTLGEPGVDWTVIIGSMKPGKPGELEEDGTPVRYWRRAQLLLSPKAMDNLRNRKNIAA